MKFRENDVVVLIVDISPIISEGNCLYLPNNKIYEINLCIK